VRSLFAVVAIAVMPSLSAAAEIVLEEGVNGYTGTADTSIYQNRPENAGGGFPHIFAGVAADATVRRALVRFDLSATPPGTVVQSAELRLVVDQSRPSTEVHTLHRVSRAWGEGSLVSTDPGGLGLPAAAGDATWLSSEEGLTSWTLAGGDFAAAPSASTSVGPLGSTATFTGSSLAQDVQLWIDQPATNFGWMIRGNESAIHNARRFHSAEGTPALRPRLTITTQDSGIAEWKVYE